MIPFVSFIVCYPLTRQVAGLQSSAIAIILLVTLIVATFKKHLNSDLLIESLPYLAMPIILFASINRKLEFSTDDAILCFSMFVATLIIFSQKENHGKWLPRSMIICGNIHLVLQILGMILGYEKLAISTFFPLANEITFFYMVTIFCSIFIYFKDPSIYWKKYSAAIGVLGFISIIVGESIHTKKFEIGQEHALGIWLGLGCGILFVIALFLGKKLNLPKKLIISLSALIFLTIISVPITAVNFNISPSPMSEATTRLANWQAGLNIVKYNPFGVGFGAYGANVMQHWPTIEESPWKGSVTVVFIAAHSQYLQILAEIGWLGWLYYCTLFAIPWFVSIFRYLKTGEPRFLCIAGTLATMLSVMTVTEAISMFAFIQIIHWMFLIYCVKALLPLRDKDVRVKMLPFRNVFLIISIPLLAFLLYDRGKQLYSMYLTFNSKAPFTQLLEIHPKNSPALGQAWLYHAEHRNFQEALKTIDKIEEMAGYLWHVNQARAETYYVMGDLKKACEAAKFPITHYADMWTQSLKQILKCENR